MTGDQTKKVRIFDLARPDADPRYLVAKGGETAHERTVKSVVWLPEGRQIVSGGEDGVVKSAVLASPPKSLLLTSWTAGGTCAATSLSIQSNSPMRLLLLSSLRLPGH